MQTRAGGDAARAAPPRQKRGATGHASALQRQQTRYAILFIAPGLAIYLSFMVYPFLNTIYLSLTNWNGVAETKDFVGLANYTRMLGDLVAWKAFSNNVIWVILATIALGLFEALLVWTGPRRGSLFFRTLFFLPFVFSLVVVGVVWGWIYNP